MIDVIYVEHEVAEHPRTLRLLKRFSKARVIPCERYGEIFNRRAQDFRLQKRQPALIVARKHDGFVLPTPEGYGIGTPHNYYFSHMLNCLYDCRYCFLQGMLPSANYLWFVNSEEFVEALQQTAAQHPANSVTFFTGYDCDSLALESVTHFVEELLPVAAALPEVTWELRTKSVRSLPHAGDENALKNVVVAFSLCPEAIAQQHEHGAPSVPQRIVAIERLAQQGWPVGLRFDPIIDHPGVEDAYPLLFREIFTRVPADSVHSVSLGMVRFPKRMHETIRKLYPEEPLLAAGLEASGDQVSYSGEREKQLVEFCMNALQEWLPREKLFPCVTETQSQLAKKHSQ